MSPRADQVGGRPFELIAERCDLDLQPFVFAVRLAQVAEEFAGFDALAGVSGHPGFDRCRVKSA